MAEQSYSLTELAKMIGATLENCDQADNTMVTGLATLESAGQHQLAFLANKSYRSQLADCQAEAVILHADMLADCTRPALVMDNPYKGFALASQLFNNLPEQAKGIHSSAQIADNAELAKDVQVAANVVVGQHVILEAGVRIGPGCVISDHSVIAANTLLHANVTIYHDVVIGSDCIIHAGTVIGSDGFGFAPEAGRWHKIIQAGGVRIGDRVEIGANTTIDRGALGNTVIGNDVILDNLIQVAHNAEIGDGTAMAACSGVAGSSKIGKNCTIGGNVGIAGHLILVDNVHVAAKTLVSKSLTEAGAYASGTTAMPVAQWRKSAARFRQLDSMSKKIQKLEKAQSAADQ